MSRNDVVIGSAGDRDRLIGLFHVAARVAAAIVFVIGFAAFAYWVFPRARWLDVLLTSRGITIKTNAAVAMMLIGASLFIRVDERRLKSGPMHRLAQTMAVLASVIGGATFFQHVSGCDLHIDQLLFTEPPGVAATASPNRMGPPASLSFFLGGIALLMLDVRTRRGGRRHSPAQYIGVFIGLIALQAILGYTFHASALYSISRLTGIAAHTAVALGAIAAGLLLARPRDGLMSLVSSDDAGGRMARRLVVPAIVIPFVLGWLRTIGENAGFYDPGFGRAVLILALTVSFTTLILWNAWLLSEESRQRGRVEAERERAIASLNVSERRLSIAQITAEAGAWDLDLRSGEVFWSPEYYRLFGLNPSAPPSMDAFYQSIHPDDRERIKQEVAELIRAAGEVRIEYRINHPQRGERWLAGRGNIISEGGRPVRMIGLSMDITRRKTAELDAERARAEAQRANRAKDEFLAVLSHELRTPLTPVLGTVQLMQEDASLPASVIESAAMIRRNIELEARLIDDLLDLTAVSRGKLSLRLTEMDAHEALTRAIEICRADIDAKRLQLHIDASARQHTLRADGPRLQQVLWNLIKNAVKFTPVGGRIEVVTSNDADGRWQLTVTDTGVGIDAALLPGIFDAFEQGGADRTRQFGGLGLGLTISKAIVDLHGGSIEARSDGQERGATFTLAIATVATQAPLPSASLITSGANGRPLDGNGAKILLVEDHLDTSRAMCRLLRSFGYDVTAVQNAAEAERAAAEAAFDLLISDLGLPDNSGHELLRRLRDRGAAMKAIAVSGYGMDEDKRRSLDCGFVEHLTKPIDIEQLRAAVGRVMGSSTN